MKKITQYVSVVALFLVPIFPLIVANSFFFPFITGKAFYFRIMVEIAFAAWVILAFLDAKYRPKFTTLNFAVTLFAVIILLADLLGVNPVRSMWSNFERMEGWITVIHLWAFYMTASSIFGAGLEGKKIWHRWLNFSIAIATVIALYGVGQLFGWFAIHQSAARLDATIGNSAYLGIYIVIHMFIVAFMYFAVRAQEFKGRSFLQWAYPALFILFTIVVLETQTRAAVIGLVAGLVLSLLLYSIFARGESMKSRRISGAIFIGIILLGIIFYAERKQPIFANSPVFSRLTNISLNSFQNEGRASIWPMAIKGGLERPILGWGQENFNYIFNANYAPKMFGQEQWFDRAHSVFIDWFVASGFVGLIAYIALYILALIMIWKSDISVAKKSVLTGLIAAYGVNNLAVFDSLASYVFFFAILALVNSFKAGKEIKVFGSSPVRTDAVEYIVAPIVIVIFVGVVYMFNVRPIQANVHLISALTACGSGKPDTELFVQALGVNTYVANQEIREQLLQCAGQVIASPQVPNQLKQNFYMLTAAEIDAQIKATPKDTRVYLLGGSFYNDIGATGQAISLLEKAHELSPTKQSVSIALANDYLGAKKTTEALELLKQAYESATQNFSAKFSYAVGLVLSGKEAEARLIFDNDPKIFMTTQIANVYASLKQYAKSIDIYQKLVASSTSDINLRASMAQVQYQAGMKSEAIATLSSIGKEFPEYKTQIDAAIKQISGSK
ncbi:MAG: O-antigen ligase family protein [Candidatus Taylorbacteria bacterium]